MVEHAFITSRGPEGRNYAQGKAAGIVTALGLPGRDERISPLALLLYKTLKSLNT